MSVTPLAEKIDVRFVSHIAAGMAEQDAFIERADVPAGQVVRPTAEDAKQPNQPLYATATATPDDPFQVGPHPLGPFAKGDPLDVTLGQWLAAAGSGEYTIQGDTAELNLTFRNLVPDGLYTVLTPRITLPPNFAVQPGIAGAPDGSQAMFRADARGNATYTLSLKPLPESNKSTVTALIIAYNCLGEWRGEFGKNTHQQLFFMIPPVGGL